MAEDTQYPLQAPQPTAPIYMDEQAVAAEYAPDFSYEQDIAPMKQMAFQTTRRLPEHQAAPIYGQASANADTMFKRQMEFRGLEQQERNRSVAFDTAVFNLTRAREETAKERQMYTSLAPILTELDVIQSDPDKSQQEMSRDLALFGTRNAQVLATNKVAATAYQNASRGLTGYTPSRAGLTASDVLRQTNLSPEVASVLKKHGYDTEDTTTTIPLDVISEAVNASRTQQAKTRITTTETAEMRKRIEEQRGYLFKQVMEAKAGKAFDRVDETIFDSEASEQAVLTTINSFGSTQERMIAMKPSTTAKELRRIAASIVTEVQAGKRSPSGTPTRNAGQSFFE